MYVTITTRFMGIVVWMYLVTLIQNIEYISYIACLSTICTICDTSFRAAETWITSCNIHLFQSSHDSKELVATDLSDYLSTKQTTEFQTYLDSQHSLSTTAYRQFVSQFRASHCV